MLGINSCLTYKKLFSEVLPWFNPVLAHYIVRNFVNKQTKTIIDMGIGPGYLVKELSKLTSARILGIDYNPEMLKIAEETLQEGNINTDNIELYLEDVHKLSFSDNSIDLIVSYSCFHHWENPVK
jgi:ubiquinone/menaquinone biosynthesis C-methylase UbiE